MCGMSCSDGVAAERHYSTSTEARRFERVLGLVGMNPGGVLDFSNDRLQEFVKDSTGLDIYDAKYSPYGTSKANRLRGFWNVEPDARVAKLLNDLLDYGVENRIITNDVELVIVACRQTVPRLSPTLPAAVALRNTQPVSVEKSHTLFSNVFYGPVGNVAQNSGHINQTANIGLRHKDLAKLVAEMATHLNELSLDPRQHQRAEAQLAALNAEVGAVDPDPGVVGHAGRTLRNITEGAIGSLLAAGIQPHIWQWVHQTLASF